MTVEQLIEQLRVIPGDMPVIAIYDCGCASGEVVSVVLSSDGEGDHVALVIE